MFCIGIAFANVTTAQQTADSSNTTAVKRLQQYDIVDLFRKISGKKQKPSAGDSAATPKKDVFITVLPVAGYSLQTGLAVSLTSGIAFSLGNSADQKISNLLTNITYTQYHQVYFLLQ